VREDGFLPYVCEFISESADCQNILRFFHIFFDYAAQTADMDIHGAIGNKGVVAPDLRKNLIP